MPELIYDERCEESFVSLGNGVFELTGATELKFAFSTATRRDGSPVITDDEFSVCFINQLGSILTSRAVYTAGSPSLLTVNDARIYKTSEPGGAAPNFGGTTGLVFHCWTGADVVKRDINGNLESPEVVRNVVAPAALGLFQGESGTLNNEGVAAQGVADEDDWLAGIWGADEDETESDDGENVLTSLTPGIALSRRSIKAWRTIRNRTIDAGGVLPILTADKPLATYGAFVVDRGNPDNYVEFRVQGDPASPKFLARAQRGALKAEIVGTGVRILNKSLSPIVVDFTPGRI
ncbi:MAG: hypothetical protein AAGB02_03180 [Pseudomonadota bacterium]